MEARKGEQQLVLAVAALALGEDASATVHAAEAQRHGTRPAQADTVPAIVDRSPDRPLRALSALIDDHALWAAGPDTAREPLRAFCSPALALAALDAAEA